MVHQMKLNAAQVQDSRSPSFSTWKEKNPKQTGNIHLSRSLGNANQPKQVCVFSWKCSKQELDIM